MTDSIRIACMGDIMPGGILHYENISDFCAVELLDELRKADVRVATLETALGDEPDFDEEKMAREKDVIYCPTKDIFRLTLLGINVVSIANNHVWDLGLRGIENTFTSLDRLGIKYCGSGRNLKEASEPAVLSVRGKTVAFIAYCDYQPGTCGYVPVATDTSPGVNALIESHICDNINELKKKYDYLFVMMHWGKEYYYYPIPQVNALARKIIDWGADGVIGSHSHQIQPTIMYHKKPIIFSLGNFLFPDRIINTPRSTFYPEKTPNISSMPTTLGYPFVKEATFKIWKPVARIGQVISITVSNQSIAAHRIFTSMDSNSHIGLSRKNKPILFWLSHILVKTPMYGFIFFCMRGCRYIRKRIKQEL